MSERSDELDTIISALEMALAALETVQWKPIETAPKGDEPLLVWDGREVTLVHWVPEPIRGGYWFAAHDHSFGWDGKPTHWMAVPEGPK